MLQTWWLWTLIGYASGSVSFALLLGWCRGIDVRKAGSGNLGATNVGRVLGRQWGALCFALDVLKGLLPVVLAGLAMGYIGQGELPAADAWRWLSVGAAAVVGHVFPFYLGFKGGKGVATSLGVLVGYWPTLTLAAAAGLITWIIIVKLTRYVSVASMIAGLTLPIFVAVGVLLAGRSLAAHVPFLIVCGLLAVLVVVRHRSNITRLRAGTETKIGAPKT